MEPKLIFLDIDGTLTPAGSNVPPASAMDAVRKAQAKGHKVFLCTGRNPAMLAPVLALGFDGAVAGADGDLPVHRYRRTVRLPAVGPAAAAEDPGGQRHRREGQDPPRAAQRHDPDLIILSAQKTASAPDDRRAGFLMRVLLFSCSRQRPGPARKPAGRMPPPI